MVRRQHLDPGLRQEHARLHHGDGPAEPSVADDLRRHHSCRLPSGGEKLDIVSAFQSYGEYLAGNIDDAPAAGDCPPLLSRRRRLRRHVHGQHDGLGHRGAGDVPPLQLLDTRRRSAEAGRVRGLRRGHQKPAGTGHQTARHHDPRGFRKRHGAGLGAGWIDQRRAPPAGHRAVGERAAVARRLPEGERPGAAIVGLQAERPVRDGGSPQRRRNSGGDEDAAGRRGIAWRLPDGDRQDGCRRT